MREAEQDGFEGLVRKSAQRLPGFTLAIIIAGLDFHLQQRERREFHRNGALPSGCLISKTEGSLSGNWGGGDLIMVNSGLRRQPSEGTILAQRSISTIGQEFAKQVSAKRSKPWQSSKHCF